MCRGQAVNTPRTQSHTHSCDYWATQWTCLAAWPANINIDPHQESSHGVQSAAARPTYQPGGSIRRRTPLQSCSVEVSSLMLLRLDVAEMMCLCSILWPPDEARVRRVSCDMCAWSLLRESRVSSAARTEHRRRTFQQQCWEYNVLCANITFESGLWKQSAWRRVARLIYFFVFFLPKMM